MGQQIKDKINDLLTIEIMSITNANLTQPKQSYKKSLTDIEEKKPEYENDPFEGQNILSFAEMVYLSPPPGFRSIQNNNNRGPNQNSISKDVEENLSLITESKIFKEKDKDEKYLPFLELIAIDKEFAALVHYYENQDNYGNAMINLILQNIFNPKLNTYD